MRRAAVICLALACLALPSAGQAKRVSWKAGLTHHHRASWTSAALDIAGSYWHTDCRVGVVWFADDSSTLGRALVGDCKDGDGWVQLNGRLLSREPWPIRCATVVHEEGHLIGLGHSPDPRDVMFPILTLTNVPRPCILR